MMGERENTNYGTLVMRAFNIDGNDINAFYDSSNNLIFVLDNTINTQKPNVLLVINSDGDKKWDEILSMGYGVDLETIRPKVDNKYQKLDIEYSGLSVYENLINAYEAGEDLEEHLVQLSILRDSAARHSAMMRLNVANEIISKTNATIVRTKDTIVRLQARIKSLRAKLSATKKEIGRVNTKQSAAKILKLESQIEASNEKLKRAQKRLESAQKRLDVATADAELASNLLNQPTTEIKQTVKSKPVMVAPEYPVQKLGADDEEIDDIEESDEEEVEESDVKPLFDEDPQILNDDIAFKPIAFDAPVFNESEDIKEEPIVQIEEPKPVLESMTPIREPEPMLESLTPVSEPEPVFTPQPIVEEEIVEEEKPVIETIKPVEPVRPITPVVNNFQAPIENKEHSKPGFIYYVLLLVLILLSVFTLWLYQKNISGDTTPVLTAKTTETVVAEPKVVEKVEQPAPVVVNEQQNDDVFLNEEPVVAEPVSVETKEQEPIEEEQDEEPIEEPMPMVEEAPVVLDAVPSRLNTSVDTDVEEENVISEEDILANKPVYEPGAKYDDMFVSEEDYESGFVSPDSESDYLYDAEEAAYQEEMGY